MPPKVSIIVPAYNAELFIDETIGSILKQSFKDWELIIVDDGSTDKTSKIVEKYLCDARVKYKYQQNSGVSIARNVGVDHSTGEYLAFLDSDDLWDETFLDNCIGPLDADSLVGMVNTNACVINEKSDPIPYFFKGHNEQAVKKILEFQSDYGTAPSSLLCRRSLFYKIGGFNPLLSNVADKLFFIEADLISKIVRIEKNLLIYRLHKRSMHHNVDLMVRDYFTLFSILDKKEIFENETHRKVCLARMYKICAGAYFDNKRYLFTILFLFRSFLLRPGFLIEESFKRVKPRTFLFKVLHYIGLGYLLLLLNRTNKRIPILLFHKVDLENNPYWPSLHPETFAEILIFLKKKYRLISLDELFIKSTNELRNCAVIVFDDGFRNFYNYAAPVLNILKVPATMFIPVDCINKQSPVWSSQIVSSIEHTDKKELRIVVSGKRYSFTLGSLKQKINASEKIHDILIHVTSSELLKIVDDIKVQLNYNPELDEKVMDWEYVDKMSSIVQFHSHSFTHPYLSNMDSADLLQFEIKNSKDEIVKRTGRDINYFSYPMGVYNQDVLNIVKQNYNAAFAVTNRLVRLNVLHEGQNKFTIPRINIHDNNHFELFFRINGFHSLFGR